MWFDFKGKKFRFGVDEFDMITGFLCEGDVNTIKFGRYFGDKKKISRKEIKNTFNSKK